MKPRVSVKYSAVGCKAIAPTLKGLKMNLHCPDEVTFFMGEDHVMGHNMLASLLPNLADVLGVPRVTNRDMRTTAIQALRMAKFSTEEVCKISRHVRGSTIERNYNIGLQSEQRADMAAAICQAPLMKRGNQFQTVSEHLTRKTNVGLIEMAKPKEMVPRVEGEEGVVARPEVETAGVDREAVDVTWIGADMVVNIEGDLSAAITNWTKSDFNSVPDQPEER